MVDPREAQKNLLSAWEELGLTFTLPPPLLTRADNSPASSSSTNTSPAGAPAAAPEADPESDGDDDGYYNHPHRDRVHDALMGIRRGKKKKKPKRDEGAASTSAAGGAVSATPPPAPKPKPLAAPPAAKPRGRKTTGLIDAQCHNDVRAMSLVEGLTMLGRSDVLKKRAVVPSGRPTPVEVGKYGVTEHHADKMRRTLEYASREARPVIICESVKQYRTASR